jgi:hypothetical protein
MTDTTHRIFLRTSLNEYLERLDSQLEPDDNYLPFKYPYITQARWRPFIDAMLEDELREVTNQLHQWHDMLRSWHAWNKVLADHDESAAWELQRAFMEPLMHHCLTKPSAFRDLMTFVGTNAIHQIRLHTEPQYLDRLEGDSSPENPDPRPLTRRQKEKRLSKIAAPLEGSDDLLKAIRQLDNEQYRNATKDYRNLNNHAIGPRLAIGVTRMVTRHVVPEQRMEKQHDGTGRLVTNTGKFVPRYGFGGTEPLDLAATRNANLEQYRFARQCVLHHTAMLENYAAKLPRAED